MPSRRRSALVALILGPAIGAAYPLVQLAFDCRAPQSEACVWGKSLLPLTIAVSSVILGALFAAAIFAALEWRRRRKEGTDAEDV